MKKIVTPTIIIFSMIVLFSGKADNAYSQCGECQNPIVQVMNVTIAGEIPDFEKWGYMPVKPGIQDGTADNLIRGFGYLFFKKKNPCADLYFIFEDVATTKRIGSKNGEAKYKVETIVDFQSVEDGYVTPVKDIIGVKTKLDKPIVHISSSGGWVQEYEYDIKSENDILVPVLAQVDITTNLICLKNGQTYDFNNILVDWIDDPPGANEDIVLGQDDHSYYMCDGPMTDENGDMHIPADGYLFGEFSPSNLSVFSMDFEKGDIGEIIRKTETPKNCKITVDHKKDYPPFFNLDITNITNEYDKQFPNDIFIAVKADKGRLNGGTFIDGWHIYPTNKGHITEKIQYTPPQCAISESDIIEFAQVCDYHDGPISVGSSKFTKKIHNPLCSDATITISSRHLREMIVNKQETIGNDNITKNSEFVEDRSGTITLQLQRHSDLSHAMLGEQWVNYMSKSRSLDSWHIEYYDHRDEHRESNVNSGGFDQKIREDAEISNVRFRTPDYPIMVTVAYDLETKKAKRIMVQASFDLGYKMHINKTRESESWNKEGSKNSDSNEARDKEDSYSFQIVGDEILDPKLKKKFPSGCLVSGGDGKNILTGYGKTEKNNPITNNAYFDGEHDLKTSQWTMTINK